MGGLRESEEIDPQVALFLAEVARPMRKLPQDRRESLMLELRTHIEKLAEDYEAEGRSSDRAITDAIAMIGDPKRVGRGYVRAWYRSTEPGGVLVALGLMSVAQGVASSLFVPVNRGLSHLIIHHSVVMVLGLSLVAAEVLIGGLVAGWYAPKGAVKAAIVNVLLQFVPIISLVTIPHRNIGWTVAQMSESALSIAVVALTVRMRMRKLAGI